MPFLIYVMNLIQASKVEVCCVGNAKIGLFTPRDFGSPLHVTIRRKIAYRNVSMEQ